MTDQDIIQEILTGNTNHYAMLVDKYKDRIFRTCIGYVHDEDEANDLTQETFINAYEKLNTFQFHAQFSTWLYRIAINLSLNHIRSKKSSLFDRIENSLDSWTQKHFQEQKEKNPEEYMISEEKQKLIQAAMDKLPEKQKTAFILSKYEDKSQKEIAEIMHTSEGAVEQLLQRGKNTLRKKLSRYFKG